MNPELEKLVDYALADGYISDKEKQVLRKKAVTLGFDPDELEMILEGKLYEKIKENKPAVEKCPSCGEIITGLNRICPSCKYVLNVDSYKDDESLQDSLGKLEKSIYDLKIAPRQGKSKFTNASLLIIITGGLYIIYKKLIKKEAIFDTFSLANERIMAVTNSQALELRQKYGADKTINDLIDGFIKERDAIIKKRQNSDAVSGVIVFFIFSFITAFFCYTATRPVPKHIETSEEKVEKLMKEKKWATAEKELENFKDPEDKIPYQDQIRNIKIDSLSKAGDYNGAIKLARQIKNSAAYTHEMEEKVDEIIEMQINELIDSKNFEQAKELADLMQYPKSDALKTSIKVAEAIEKNKTKKRKK